MGEIVSVMKKCLHTSNDDNLIIIYCWCLHVRSSPFEICRILVITEDDVPFYLHFHNYDTNLWKHHTVLEVESTDLGCLGGDLGMCPQLSCAEFTKWVELSHWLTQYNTAQGHVPTIGAWYRFTHWWVNTYK